VWVGAPGDARVGRLAGLRVVCGCAGAAGGYIVEVEMRTYFSRFGFTFRYWRTIAGSAD
jgi:hypothetical protein